MIFNILIAIIIIAVYFVHHRYSYWKRRDIPYEEPSFPYGNIKDIGTKHHKFDILTKIYEKFKHNPSPFVGMFHYLEPVVLCTKIEFVKKILVSDAAHFIDRGSYYNERDNPISAHLFNLDNPKWQQLRTKLTPTFTSGRIKIMFHTVCDVGEKFVKKLQSESEISTNNEIEIKEISARFTTDVIGEIFFYLFSFLGFYRA